MSTTAIQPLRFALSSSPPALVLEYRLCASGEMRHHLMPLDPDILSDSHTGARHLQRQHEKYFSQGIDLEQVANLLKRLLTLIEERGRREQESKRGPTTTQKETKKEAQHLLPAKERELTKEEADYEEDFEVVEEEEAGEDEEDNVEELSLDNLLTEISDEMKAKPLKKPVPSAASSATSTSRAVGERSPAVKPLPPALDVDLNKASDFALRSAKAVMNVSFEANALRPGDPGYVYNKEVDFHPALEPSDWD